MSTSQSTAETLESFSRLKQLTPENKRGNSLRLGLDNVSYYPSREVSIAMGRHIYGIDITRQEIAQSESFKKYKLIEKEYLESHKRGPRPIGPHDPDFCKYPLHHCQVEGELVVKEEDGLVSCVFDLKAITDERNIHPQLNVSIIPRVALLPNIHIVRNLGNIGRNGHGATFYTSDLTDSEWSIHAWNCD